MHCSKPFGVDKYSTKQVRHAFALEATKQLLLRLTPVRSINCKIING